MRAEQPIELSQTRQKFRAKAVLLRNFINIFTYKCRFLGTIAEYHCPKLGIL